MPHWRLILVPQLTFRGEYAGVGEGGLEKGENRVVVAVENEDGPSHCPLAPVS